MTDDSKISKSEAEHGKRYKKSLKEEGKAMDDAFKTKLKEFEQLQKVHKQATKDEATAVASHSKAVKDEHKLDLSFISARSKHESALTELKAEEEAVIITRRHAGEQKQLLQEKQKEIDDYREKKAVEDRKREAKLSQLTSNPATTTT